LISMIRGWFTNPLVPAITKAHIRGDQAFIERAVYTVTKIAWVISVFPVVMLATCAEDVLQAYVGEAGSGLTMWLTFWMLSFMGAYLAPVTSVLFARGDLKPLVVFTLVGSSATFLLYWLLAPLLNVGATVVGNVFFTLSNILFFHLYMLRRLELSPVRLLKSAFAGPFAAAVVTGLAVWWLREVMAGYHHWPRLIASGFTGLIVYAGLIFSLVMKPDEFKRYVSEIRGV
ncbi:MAG: polysaccharide biosynthesis C-terminal domain-containing protein, partial [Kiritimatiellia bacterium]